MSFEYYMLTAYMLENWQWKVVAFVVAAPFKVKHNYSQLRSDVTQSKKVSKMSIRASEITQYLLQHSPVLCSSVRSVCAIVSPQHT